MTLKSDALANAICMQRPLFSKSGSFIYRRNPVLMLRGFAFDMPPGGCYVWKYMLPLFKPVEYLNLNLGFRVPGGYFETKNLCLSDMTACTLKIIDQFDDFDSEESLQEILDFCRRSEISPSERRVLIDTTRHIDDRELSYMYKVAASNLSKLKII